MAPRPTGSFLAKPEPIPFHRTRHHEYRRGLTVLEASIRRIGEMAGVAVVSVRPPRWTVPRSQRCSPPCRSRRRSFSRAADRRPVAMVVRPRSTAPLGRARSECYVKDLEIVAFCDLSAVCRIVASAEGSPRRPRSASPGGCSSIGDALAGLAVRAIDRYGALCYAHQIDR